MKNPKLLRLLLKSTREWTRFLRKNNLVVKPISKKYFPANTFLRSWYNQAYLSFHTGMPDAALSLIFLIIERVTRDVYNKVIENPKKENRIDWEVVLSDLKIFFEKNKKKPELEAIEIVKWMKDTGRRNKHQHADVDAILKRYDFKAVELNIQTRDLKKTFLSASSPILPESVKVKTKHNITALTALAFLQYLPRVVKPLHKYIEEK